MGDRFNRRDGIFLLVCVVIFGATLWYTLANFQRAHPEASIRFDQTRAESRASAEQLLADLGLEPGDRRYAGAFTWDDTTKVYLERELGLESANEIMGDEVPLWRWSHRWFRPLEKEEYRVSLATTGELAHFSRLIEEDAEGARLEQEEARGIALAFLTDVKGLDPAALELIEPGTEVRPNRTDHTFVWERVGWSASEATYRYRVTVQGDAIGGYSEFLRVPEEWKRDYQELRSWNGMAGNVAFLGMLLTAVAMLGVLIFRARRRDVRWKTSIVFGAIAAVLLLLHQINTLPLALYGYDTTDSWWGFLTFQIAGDLASSLGIGLLIFLVVAAGEPLYRERFGRFLSVRRMFTPAGFRTKKFFRGVVLGYALTGFFFAYQIVFYLIAERYGAWSPAQIKYDELLNTAIPWVFVLFVGFLPSVSEEFISRAFSIAFVEKFTRSKILAVVIPAAIWGFGHSAYPNQPFFIRGLEVGIAGIIIGVLLYRYGLLPLLVWHYTVDAAYTALPMLRSGDTYYVTSAAIGVGLILLPAVGSLLLYFVRGGFRPEEGLTNADEGTAPPPEREEAPEPAPLSCSPFTGRGRIVLVALAVVFGVLVFAPGPRVGDFVEYPMRPEEAREIARGFLAERGFDLTETRTAEEVSRLYLGDDAEYLIRHGGVEQLNRVLRDEVPHALWYVRFFRPEEKEEWSARVNPRTGKVPSFTWTLPEDAAGADIPEEEARPIAAALASEMGHPVEGWEEVRARSEKPETRRDHTFIWERPGEEMGEAHIRVTAGVLGDRPGRFNPWLKLPESWTRESEEKTLVHGLWGAVASGS